MNPLKSAAIEFLFTQTSRNTKRNDSPVRSVSSTDTSSTSCESKSPASNSSPDAPIGQPTSASAIESTGSSFETTLVNASNRNIEGSGHTNRSFFIPQYARRIPEDIAQAFDASNTDGLKGTDANFRKLVKQYCKLPAYFGVVMIQRIQEYRKIVADLVLEQQLSQDCLDYIPQYCESISPSQRQQKDKQKIGLRDFLRFWTPEIRNQNRLRKFLRIVSPPTRECILALERDEPIPQGSSLQKRLNLRFLPQNLRKEHLGPLVEALVDRHPDLVSLKHNQIQRSRYVTTVLTSLFFRCTGNDSDSIPLTRVIESNISSLFYRCATCSLTENPTFTVTFFDCADKIFQRCVVSGNKQNLQEQCNLRDTDSAAVDTCIRIESLKSESIFDVCQPAIFERLYLHANRGEGMQYFQTFTYEDLIRFMLALEDQMMSFSLRYWFRLLDLDDDGYLNRVDLETIYRRKLHIHGINKELEKFKHFNSVFCSVLDMLNGGSQELLISPMDVRRSGGGAILFDLFILRTKFI